MAAAAPSFTASNVMSEITAYFHHLKIFHGFCGQDFLQLLLLCVRTHVHVYTTIFAQGTCDSVEVTHMKCRVVNGISIFSLWNIHVELTKDSGAMH